jgi:4-hydroxybenzoate polyprenyltransferase
MPILQRSTSLTLSHWMLLLERAFFVFAITIPFDIRDLKIDKHIAVKTIPAIIGIKASKKLAALSFLMFFAFVIMNWYLGVYTNIHVLSLLVVSIISYLLVHYSDQTEADYFFTGLLDGTMIFQLFMLLAFDYFL